MTLQSDSTSIQGFNIRTTCADDAALILSFVRDLAEYEKLSHEVVATEEQLRAALFGPKPAAEVVIGELEGSPVAFALFFHNFSTFLGKPGLYLEDLFVKPEYRGRGLGEVMLCYIANIARKRGCGRFEWAVLDWNKPALDFYAKLGAVPMSEWTVQRVTGEALTRLADKNLESK